MTDFWVTVATWVGTAVPVVAVAMAVWADGGMPGLPPAPLPDDA